MRETEAMGSIYRFGSFELHQQQGELRKRGVKIKLQDQPLQILLLLLEHTGRIVSREEIQHRLWPPGTHVDYDNAINSAVRKLREALGDISETPRFIETLPRRGYRFLVMPEQLSPNGQKSETAKSTLEAEISGKAKPRRRIEFVAIASGLALIAAAIVFWQTQTQKQERDVSQLTPLPLTSTEGAEQYPGLSPDGNQIVYSWDRGVDGGPSHLYTKGIDPGGPVQLTFDQNSDFAPAWSPDGRYVAFIRTLHPGSNAIYAVPASGGVERKLADGFLFYSFSWSPDGRFLVAAGGRSWPFSSLYLVDVESGVKVRLTTPADARTVDRYPAISPDGSVVLFARCNPLMHCGLYLLNLTSNYRVKRGPWLLRQEKGEVVGIAWTIDGKEAVYGLSIDSTDNAWLMRIRMDNGAAQRLAYAGDHVYGPAIARRGNRLAYIQEFGDQDLSQIQPGKPARAFASSRRDENSAQYSPDGTRVVFASDRTGLMQIWVCDKDGGNPAQLTHFERGHSGTPRWSPDGRLITFDRQLDEGWRIFVMASDGGTLRRLTNDSGADEIIPSWSRDGKWIYYSSNRHGGFQIWRASSQTGRGAQLTRNGGLVAFESHDGRSIYYRGYTDPSLWILPLTGGKEKLVVDSVCGRGFNVVEDGIYYLSCDNRGDFINFHRFATNRNEEIARVKDLEPMGLAVSLDRKTFLFTTTARGGANVMVVNNFY